MAERAATVHWQIAERVLWYVRLGATNEEAVLKAAQDFQATPLALEDVTKIANAMDELSAQYQPAGYWYNLALGAFIPNVRGRLGLSPLGGFKMPGWGWALLIVGVGFVVFRWAR